MGGRRTLNSDVDYTVQPAADGSGNVDPAAQRGRDHRTACDPRAGRTAATPTTAAQDECEHVGAAHRPVPPAPAAARSAGCASSKRHTAKLRLRRCQHAGRDCGLFRRGLWHPSIATWPRNMAAPFLGVAGATGSADRTAHRFFGYRDRCPTMRCIGDAYVGPHARDPRHHGRSLAARGNSWISRGELASQPTPEPSHSSARDSALRPASRLLVLHHARRRDGAEDHCGARGKARLSRRRDHRPQRPLRRDAVQRGLHRQGRAADHRRDAGRGPTNRIGGEAGDRLARPPGQGRARLRQSLQARLSGTSRPPARTRTACRTLASSRD